MTRKTRSYEPATTPFLKQFENQLALLMLAGAFVALLSKERSLACAFAVIAFGNVYMGSKSTALRELDRLFTRLLLGGTLLAIVFGFTAAAAGFGSHDSWLFGLGLLAALAPTSLASSIVVISDARDSSRFSRLNYHNFHKVVRCILTDNFALLALVLGSFAGRQFWHIPLAISPLLILALTALVTAAPITALGWDNVEQSAPRDVPVKLAGFMTSWRTLSGLFSFGTLAAAIAYAGYLLFFARRGLSPVNIDAHSQLYRQATTLTFATLAGCQLANIMVVRSDERHRFGTSYLWNNKKLLKCLAAALTVIAAIAYLPGVHTFFHAGPLSALDVLATIALTGVYLACRLLQRYTRRYSHAAFLHDHDPETLRNHPKLA